MMDMYSRNMYSEKGSNFAISILDFLHRLSTENAAMMTIFSYRVDRGMITGIPTLNY